MGTLFSALDIGRAGLGVAQVQLDVAGHNIANVNKEGYSRQRVNLTTRVPNFKSYGAIGRGPAIASIERLRDAFLDKVYRQQSPTLGQAEVESTYFRRAEDIFQEPSETGFGRHLSDFFDALNDFANDVEDLPTRNALLESADSTATSLNAADDRIQQLRTAANDQIRDEVEQINSLIDRITKMNKTIREQELSGQRANDQRDDRDVLLDELSKLVNIVARERDDGQVDVLIGGTLTINGDLSDRLVAAADPTIDPRHPGFVTVRFASDNQRVQATGGELFGLYQIRDVELKNLTDRMDTLAAGLIHSINRIHSQGNGLQNISAPSVAAYGVSDPNASLASGGVVPFSIEDGAFEIVVYDSAGNEVGPRLSIPITASGPVGGQTTLNDIVSAINASANLNASVDAQGRLVVTPNAGFTYGFANDTAGVLAALGMNGLFTGTTAEDIALSSALRDRPDLLTSSYSTDVLQTGDNAAALDLVAVNAAKVLDNANQTLQQYYQSTVVQVGVGARANEDVLNVEKSFIEDITTRRQEGSGVNLDEEVTSLIQFQRAFEASARIITVTDRMLEVLSAMGA